MNERISRAPYAIGFAAAILAGSAAGFANYRHMAGSGQDVVGFHIVISACAAAVVAGLSATAAGVYISDVIYKGRKR